MNNAKLTSTPQSFDFAGWNALLGSKDAMSIAPNTTLTRDETGAIIIVLHATTIVRFQSSGRINVHTGGWNTPLTRQRMNLVLPQNVRITSVKGTLTVLLGSMKVPADMGSAEIDFTQGLTGSVTV